MGAYDVMIRQRKSGRRYTTLGRIEYTMNLLQDVADENFKYSVPLSWRKCRFTEETDGLWAFKYYSNTACVAQCYVVRKLKFCNCTDFLAGYSKSKYNCNCFEFHVL